MFHLVQRKMYFLLEKTQMETSQQQQQVNNEQQQETVKDGMQQ